MIYTHLAESIYIEIKYKNRTSIAIKMDGYGVVEVHAPKGTSDEKVRQVIEEQWDAIQGKRREMESRLRGPEEKIYEYGENFLYLGNSHPIQIFEDMHERVEFMEEKLHIYVGHCDGEKIKQALKRFYYQQCKALVEKSIAVYQSNFQMKPRSIQITDSKTTWGTCDSNRKLTFNWRLAMAPREVIDYVVVHEMCHMVHLNHDRSFWRLVGKIMPDYKKKENWLYLSSWRMTV
ncbi:SprT family zinc-dependent metalloprotease [Robertmurraya sp. DFI.2.37]|uniref:M48 family metallopeptidase n=1 Tax=Robertmurraya sp. DFI.2.37 TaxID=3031819 RepID=UPI0012474317|nr:SprT family zinc-dependent metalloprotease [Robertmurraya sp. DFI.2.37]MDF1509778.1 SprT family zinc-dependent metalloprotease [Robertmurraya sp. DFI.2.37]